MLKSMQWDIQSNPEVEFQSEAMIFFHFKRIRKGFDAFKTDSKIAIAIQKKQKQQVKLQALLELHSVKYGRFR